MTSILTADIIGSRKNANAWLDPLKKQLGNYGKSPQQWELYRGDSFQLEIPKAAESLKAALEIKAILKVLKMDARISIGIGEISQRAQKITESNGDAFIKSGESFETLKPQKLKLVVNSGNQNSDVQLNLMLKMVSALVDGWLPQSAEFVSAALAFPELSQDELGKKLGIAQAAVSRRRKRANFDLILETEEFYRKTINAMTP